MQLNYLTYTIDDGIIISNDVQTIELLHGGNSVGHEWLLLASCYYLTSNPRIDDKYKVHICCDVALL